MSLEVLPFAEAKPWAMLIRLPEHTLLDPAIALQERLHHEQSRTVFAESGLGLVATRLGLVLISLSVGRVTRTLNELARMLEKSPLVTTI